MEKRQQGTNQQAFSITPGTLHLVPKILEAQQKARLLSAVSNTSGFPDQQERLQRLQSNVQKVMAYAGKNYTRQGFSLPLVVNE